MLDLAALPAPAAGRLLVDWERNVTLVSIESRVCTCCALLCCAFPAPYPGRSRGGEKRGRAGAAAPTAAASAASVPTQVPRVPLIDPAILLLKPRSHKKGAAAALAAATAALAARYSCVLRHVCVRDDEDEDDDDDDNVWVCVSANGCLSWYACLSVGR